MAYSKSREAYPRIVSILVESLARKTNTPLTERTPGDNVLTFEFDSPTEANSIRYNIYGWIQLLLESGFNEEIETAKAAQRWKIAAIGNKVVCRERDNPATLSRVLNQLMEQGLL